MLNELMINDIMNNLIYECINKWMKEWTNKKMKWQHMNERKNEKRKWKERNKTIEPK